MMTAGQQVHQSIGRAAAVLDALAAGNGSSLRASEIAEAADLGLSTTTRLLGTLMELGYVAKTSDRDFVLGPRLLAPAAAELNHNTVFRESRMLCQELARITRLSANVAVREGVRCLYLCHFEGDLAPKNQSMVGATIPLHASGLGKCLLLGTTQAQRVELLGAQLRRFTRFTVTDHEELTRVLGEVADAGLAVEEQELALGRVCLAAPIRDRSGQVCAAISVSGRVSLLKELDRGEIEEQLFEVADRISVNLGHLGGTSVD